MEARAPSREDRIAVLRVRDGDFCMHPDCGKLLHFDRDEVTIDHWMPLTAGGDWNIENLRLMHRRCNQYKADLIPHADGTLPARKKSTFKRRAEKRQGRVELCELCMSGRLLGYEETCPECGSGPQPSAAPTLYQLRPKECPHAGPWHCWMCFLGMVSREPASKQVFDGDFLDP